MDINKKFQQLLETQMDYSIPVFTGSHDKPISPKKRNLTRDIMADPDSGMDGDVELEEAKKTSTERVRRYYRRNRKRVREYLRKTQDDRVARNRDRKKAVKKHGKAKMHNHDVHHPNGPHGGSWQLAKKDHGPDKKNESMLPSGILLIEGGAAGHLAHPFEDENLTFADMKTMVTRGLTGGLDTEAPVTEKLDGQNIAFSVRDGRIVFARNKGHLKNKGRNALDVKGIQQMFAGRGNIEKAFGGAAEDLQAAIEKLSPEQIEQMFGGGSKFMSLEIILPDTQNVIPYGKSVLVMHGTIEYDETGEEVGRSTTDGREFADAITAVGADKQKTFGISGPQTIAFSDAESERYQEKADEYVARLDRAAATFGLGDTATLSEYRQSWWRKTIENTIIPSGVTLRPEEVDGLISRWADGNKKFGVKDIQDPTTKAWFREFEKTELKSAQKKMIQPIETTFLQAGTDALRRVTNFMAANNPEASVQLKQDVLQAIKAIRDSNQPDKIAKLQQELERLEGMGIDNIVPSEGVVFIYNGNPYKFTGQFAPINQITGTFKFGMAPESKEDTIPPEEPTTSTLEPTPSQQSFTEPPRTIAIFTGRFQPFHAGHYSVYQAMVEKFGKENVYIATSNVTDAIKSPFEFNDKKDIITRMFGVPEDMVVQVKNPYAPKEILEKFPPNTRYVTAVSQKDAERLGGKYFKNIDEVPPEEQRGFAEQGYFMIAPEMQLAIDGKNISGTQLRAVMGDKNVTERAKKEIFTKVYGKFDQKIFNKIVKTTTASEEARVLTAQHGKSKKKKETTKKATETPPKKSDEETQVVKDILRQRIQNPETKRKIYVGTALGYDPESAVRKEAEAMIKRALAAHKRGKKPTTEVLVESKKTTTLKVYNFTRPFTETELKREIEEYFENEVTYKAFPGLADSPEELIGLIKKAPEVIMSREELEKLENSEVGEVLTSKTPEKVLKKIQSTYGRDVVGIAKDMKEKQKFAMPVVIKYDDGHYLMTGNTRLAVLASIGFTMPVKMLTFAGTKGVPGRAKGADKKDFKSHKKAKDKLFKDLMNLRITNPDTGNEIKIDTAMDYNKNHPAHQLALNIVRQRMKGLSSRAGVPKPL